MNAKSLILAGILIGFVLLCGAGAADDSGYVVVVGDSTTNPIAEQTPTQNLRDTATETLDVPDDSLATSILQNIRFDGELTGLMNVFTTLETPYKSVFGEALYYILLFGVLVGLVWIGSGSVKIPAILGLGFSGFAMVFLPNAWQVTIFVLIAVIISTGIMFVWISRREVD